MSGRWFEQRKDFTGSPAAPRDAAPPEEVPDLYTKCSACGELLLLEALTASLGVCPVCDHHHRIPARVRLDQLCDPGTRVFHDAELRSVDALGFVDSKPYPQRLTAARGKTGLEEAFVAATATLEGIPLEIGAFDFRFLGGSMGSVVGEMITRLIERAHAGPRPVVLVSASGGARMQEGVLSLMQMAKTSAALSLLKDEAHMPYLSVLTHPTTGGVAASFSMLGDVIVSEPGALIGFAGPRVIKQTIGEDLPEGFQTAEYLLEHGMLDAIVHRHELRPTLGRLLRMLLRLPPRGDA